jgi:rhodanese-related sulfurtransferase
MKGRAVQYRAVGGAAAVTILVVMLLWGCSSDGEKTSTANGKAPAQTAEAFARLDPAAFADRMNDSGAAVINVHIPYEGELEQTDAFIPYDKILSDSRLPKDKDGEILLYCRSGRMSEEAGTALHDAGYTNIAHLEGGMKGWEAAGRTLIHDPAHAPQETPAPMQHG